MSDRNPSFSDLSKGSSSAETQSFSALSNPRIEWRNSADVEAISTTSERQIGSCDACVASCDQRCVHEATQASPLQAGLYQSLAEVGYGQNQGGNLAEPGGPAFAYPLLRMDRNVVHLLIPQNAQHPR